MEYPMPSSLVKTLNTLEDPRMDRTKLHNLTDIIPFAWQKLEGGELAATREPLFKPPDPARRPRLRWQSVCSVPAGTP